jgi:cell wall-associated NlpC family hydrolase
MLTNVEEQRKLVVEEAITWVGTPYHHDAAIKGVGVDCGRLLLRVGVNVGLIDPIHVESYSEQWFLHRGEEKYIGWLEKFTKRIEGPPLPGDLVVYKFGHCYAHGAIVIDWPLIIHAYRSEKKCVWGNASMGDLAKRKKVFYSLWGP